MVYRVEQIRKRADSNLPTRIALIVFYDLIGLCLGLTVLLVPVCEQFQCPFEESDHVRSDSPQGLGVRDDCCASQDNFPGVFYLDGQNLDGGGQHECDRFGFLQVDGILQLVNRIQIGNRFQVSVQVIERVIADKGHSCLVGLLDLLRTFLCEFFHESLDSEL